MIRRPAYLVISLPTLYDEYVDWLKSPNKKNP